MTPSIAGFFRSVRAAGFVNRDLLETVLGNLLECVAPGSHNASQAAQATLTENIEEIADQLYAMIYQSLQAAQDENGPIEDVALQSAFALISRLPQLKTRALWNRFASLKDPAVWDAYLRKLHNLDDSDLATFSFAPVIDEAIEARDFDLYETFLAENGLQSAFAYQMQLVASAYPGWRVLFYHDIANCPHAKPAWLKISTARPFPSCPAPFQNSAGVIIRPICIRKPPFQTPTFSNTRTAASQPGKRAS